MAAWVLRVYVAVATGLAKNPLAMAMAFTVVVEVSVNGPLYGCELVLGVLPSVV